MLESNSVPTRGLIGAEPFSGLVLRLRALAAHVVAQVAAEVAMRWRIHCDRRHLLEMDERLLEDVGLTRHELLLRLNGQEPGSRRP